MLVLLLTEVGSDPTNKTRVSVDARISPGYGAWWGWGTAVKDVPDQRQHRSEDKSDQRAQRDHAQRVWLGLDGWGARVRHGRGDFGRDCTSLLSL